MIHLPIILLIYLVSKHDDLPKLYYFAFGLGLAVDLIDGNQMGTLAMLYLAVTLIVLLFKSKYDFNKFTLGIFMVISQIIFFYARGLFR